MAKADGHKIAHGKRYLEAGWRAVSVEFIGTTSTTFQGYRRKAYVFLGESPWKEMVALQTGSWSTSLFPYQWLILFHTNRSMKYPEVLATFGHRLGDLEMLALGTRDR